MSVVRSASINLLPDFRQQKQRNKQRRQLFTAIMIVIWIVCGVALLILGLVLASEKIVLGNRNSQISSKETQLRNTSDLVNALTAQQNLNSLATLYGQRTYLSKFFSAYSSANPASTSLSTVALDASNNLTVSGVSSSYAGVAELATALSNETTVDGSAAFSGVTITGVTRSTAQVAFNITASLAQGVTSGK